MIVNKRGPIVSVVGLSLVIISLSIASYIVPSNISEINRFSDSLFEGMFNQISDQIQILPGDSNYFSYSTFSSDVPLLWGVRIVDYESGDKLSINISNIFGDDFGEFIQDDPVFFDRLEITQSDTLNIEVKNIGTRNVNVIAMFSEEPENNDPFLNTDSSTMNMIFLLALSGFLLILGIIISLIGVIVFLVDVKNIQNNKRNY